MRDSHGCFPLITIVAALAFGFSLLAVPDNPVLAVLGMGFSAVVFTLGLVGIAVGHAYEELRLLTQRRRQRQEAKRRAESARLDIEWRIQTAKRKAAGRQQRKMWRGRWARFRNGVRRRIARMLGKENEILQDVVRAFIRIAPLWALAAAAIVAWSLLR